MTRAAHARADSGSRPLKTTLNIAFGGGPISREPPSCRARSVTICSPTLATLLSLPRASLVSVPFTRFILAEDLDLFHLHRKKLIEFGEAMDCDLRVTTSGDGFGWVRVSALVAPELDGRPLVRMTVADIGDRKQAEMVLRQSLREQAPDRRGRSTRL